MKPLRILAVLVVVVCIGPRTISAQNTSTQGKDFWVSFMGNGFKTRYIAPGIVDFTWLRIQLIVSAKRDCQCTVSNPNTGFEHTFQVDANSTYLFDNIPWDEAYMELDEHGVILTKGLHVTATDTISVYCANIADVSFDASYILPTPALGDDYIIQTFDQSEGVSTYYDYYTSAFLIVATEEGETTVDITPYENTLDGHVADVEYSITLQQGETYQVRSNPGDDLSGSRVTARDCKKIAVFNGNNLTMVPESGNDSDCIFEQAMPLTAWGKKFVVTASLGRQLNDYVKITSAHNNNVILKNGNRIATLNTGGSIVFELTQSEKSCFIEASSSCAVYLYNHSADGFISIGNGAPSMVWIAPIEQRINEITFSTFNYESEHDTHIDEHYVNIIVNADDVQNVYLDNELLSPSQFESVNGTSEYRFIRKQITHDSHHLNCDKGFNAHVYGFGHAKGYAYLVGSNAVNLSTNVSVNDIHLQSNDVIAYCTEETMTFLADVNFQNANILWNFGDGSTSTDNPATHVYHEKGIFEASLFVDADASGCYAGNSDTAYFFIDLTQKYVTEHDVVCADELYSGYGFSNIPIHNDTILARLQDNPDHPECKDSLLLYITTIPNYHVPISDSRCWQDTPAIYDDYGFSFEYDAPGSYERTLNLQTTQGCDSIVTLTLNVANNIAYDFNHHECNGSFVWDGRIYDQAGTYSWTYTSAAGCDSIATLHLTMGQTQIIEFDTILCGSFIWDGTEYTTSGDFTRYYTTHDGCDSIVTCHLDVEGNVEGPTTTTESCDSYDWEGSTYTESGDYIKAYPTPLGCDSIVHLNLTINHSPDPSDIFPDDPENIYPHWVVTATEFQINSYVFHFWDHNNNCIWDSVSWQFENPDIRWLLEPDSTTSPVGKKCRIFILNYVEDTVWIKATAYNYCNPQGAERRYWFVCSFYGIEESLSSDSEPLAVDVSPNPNSGSMRIHFGNLEGSVSITVYDMQGQVIDRLNHTATPQSTIDYNLGSRKGGIYLFVFSYNGVVTTKKIVITG